MAPERVTNRRLSAPQSAASQRCRGGGVNTSGWRVAAGVRTGMLGVGHALE